MMQRPMRRIGDIARHMLGCPLCSEGKQYNEQHPLRVVAYRVNTMRLECPVCGLRFSVDVRGMLEAIDRKGGVHPHIAKVVFRSDLY